VGYAAKVQSHIQEERVMSIIHWIGIDDHADKWTIAQYRGDEEKPTKEFELVPTESGYRRLIAFVKSLEGEARIVYEAGPCGYELYRRLTKAGLRCEVAAPSLTPRKPGDRVKTNRRDAAKLGRYLRAGDLTLIAVPTPEREALRDLVRMRFTVRGDLVAARNQLSKMLLRYGHRYREGQAWTGRYWTWVRAVKLPHEASRIVLEEMIVRIEQRREQLQRFDDLIEQYATQAEYVPYVKAFSVLRGINTLSAMTILAELGDLRRFASARQLMGAIGLVPSEYSTGDKVRRYAITKTGNAHVRHIVVEAAWHYPRGQVNGRTIQARRKGQPQRRVDIAMKCDLRLKRKFNRLTARGKRSTVAAVAVARELAGFIWAIGQTL
jgi:transposase